jgi:hypothetical protein
MNKQFFCMLLMGAVLLSAGTFVSCSDNNDDLESRLTVVEGMIRDLKEQLENLPAGSTITSATQNNGIWTLVLSSGQTITINPSAGGGGLAVVEKENSIVITIDDKDYELPLGPGFRSLVYVPEFTDGEVRVASEDGKATVTFLAKPALTTATLGNATFSIGAAHEQQTRSARDLFNVDGNVTLDGDYIKVPIRTMSSEAAGKTYGVALQMELGGSIYLSNYFNVVVPGDFSGTPENIVPAQLIAAITDYAELEDGFSTATLPSSVDPLGTFNFKNLFSSLPQGTVKFELGARSSQNNNVTSNNRYDVFRNALSSDGTWELKARPGTNGDSPNAEQHSGILVNVIVNDVIVHKIYWKIVDPIAAVADAAFAGSFGGGPHIEYPENVVWEKGASTYNFNKKFTEGDFNPMHDQGAFVNNFKSFGVTVGTDELIYNDGNELQMGELGEKLAKHSRGLYWTNIQTSIAASQRRNLDIPDEQKGNGEIINGYDGISTEEMWNTFGFRITNTGLEMSEKYGGQALRVGVGLRYEYAYGERSIGNGVLVFLWINRRVCPADVTDPAPR